VNRCSGSPPVAVSIHSAQFLGDDSTIHLGLVGLLLHQSYWASNVHSYNQICIVIWFITHNTNNLKISYRSQRLPQLPQINRELQPIINHIQSILHLENVGSMLWQYWGCWKGMKSYNLIKLSRHKLVPCKIGWISCLQCMPIWAAAWCCKQEWDTKYAHNPWRQSSLSSPLISFASGGKPWKDTSTTMFMVHLISGGGALHLQCGPHNCTCWRKNSRWHMPCRSNRHYSLACPSVYTEQWTCHCQKFHLEPILEHSTSNHHWVAPVRSMDVVMLNSQVKFYTILKTAGTSNTNDSATTITNYT
jgi:hypothetical protein